MRYGNESDMAGYTKLFSRILDSTIWREDDKTRILWITMLALADKDGIVQSTVPGLADRARISLQECEAALERFQQPDKYSWSQEKEGRRIEVVEGGWFLINHAKYRALMSQEEQREKTRLRVQRFRERNAHVTLSNVGNDIAEAKADTDTKAIKVKSFVRPTLDEVRQYCKEQGNSVDPQKWFDYYSANGWRVGRNPMKDWKAAVRTWAGNGFQKRGDNAESISKNDERVRRNQEAIIAGLGFGRRPESGESDLQDGDVAGGNTSMAKLP